MYKNAPLLSARERRIIELLAEGQSHARIASQLRLTTPEVQLRVQKMLHKQGFESPFQLISWAYREAILS